MLRSGFKLYACASSSASASHRGIQQVVVRDRRRRLYTRLHLAGQRLSLYVYGSPPKVSGTQFSTRTVTPTITDKKWKDATEKLLRDDAFVADPSSWHQAEETLKYWMSQRHDLETCWKILDHMHQTLLQQQKQQQQQQNQQQQDESPKDTTNAFLSLELTNALINHWREQSKQAITKQKGQAQQNVSNLPILPRILAEKLKRYQNDSGLILIDCKTRGLILDAAASYSKVNPREGVHFVDAYFQEWIRLYKRQHQQTTTIDKPDEIAFGSVIHAWVDSDHPDAPKRAEQYLFQIMPQLQVQPNVIIYSSVMSAWAKQGNAKKVQKLVRRMQERDNLDPDILIYNSLLTAWANDRDNLRAAIEAETILERMQQIHEQGLLKSPPDVFSYSIAIDAWAKRAGKDKRAGKKALALLEQMLQRNVEPNLVVYNTVLAALSRSGEPQTAEDLLRTMTSSSTPQFPDSTSCLSVISGWATKGTIQAAERAEEVLKVCMPQLEIEADLRCYSATIHCWAKASRPNRAIPVQRAQALFDELKSKGMSPDVVTLSALLNTYGRNGQVRRAEGILIGALNEWKHTDASSRTWTPNAHLFTPVLSAWSRSRDPQAAIYAERLLRTMSRHGVESNTISYSIVLHAWAKSEDPVAPFRARAILDLMNAPSTETSKRPNSVSYTIVIQAHARQGQAEEAEALLRCMMSDPSLPNPDQYTFSSVLHAWSKTKSHSFRDAAERAESILMEMQELSEEEKRKKKSSKTESVPPNIVCFGNVLSCWAKVEVGGAERCQAILEVMQRHGTEPNLITYNILLKAWANSKGRSSTEDDHCDGNGEDRSSSSNTNTKIGSLRHECYALEQMERVRQTISQRGLVPDFFTFREMWSAVDRVYDGLEKLERWKSLLQDMGEVGVSVSKSMQEQFDTLLDSTRDRDDY